MTVTMTRGLALRAEGAGRAAWHTAVLHRGRDVTDRSDRSSTVVLAPHPDDESLGCGAAIARKRAHGTAVRVVVIADGRSSHRSTVIGPDELASLRAAEVANACRVLGVDTDEVHQLGFRDDSLAHRQDELVARLDEEIVAAAPDEVLVTSRHDWHPDHRALNAAVRRWLAGRASAPRILEYPVWHWIHGPWEAGPSGPWPRRRPVALVRGLLRPSVWRKAELVSVGAHLDVKRRAIHEHRSQTVNLTGEPGWATFEQGFIDAFLQPHEVFVPMRTP